MFIILINPKECVHHKTNDLKVAKYKESILAGSIFPPIEVVEKDGIYFVLDGSHRAKACVELNEPILAMVYEWDYCPKRYLVGSRLAIGIK